LQLSEALKDSAQDLLAHALNLVVLAFFQGASGRAALRKYARLRDECEDGLVVAQFKLVSELQAGDARAEPVIRRFGQHFQWYCTDVQRKRARREYALEQNAPALTSGPSTPSAVLAERRDLEALLRGAVARVARRKPRSQKRLLLDSHSLLWGRRQMPRGTALALSRRCGLSVTSVRTTLCSLRRDVRRELNRCGGSLAVHNFAVSSPSSS
jgi:hypothetical protein